MSLLARKYYLIKLLVIISSRPIILKNGTFQNELELKHKEIYYIIP